MCPSNHVPNAPVSRGPSWMQFDEFWRLNAAYDSAKQNQADNVDALVTALEKAREAECVVARALREHIEQHGCTV
jgi:hypothetical protein